MVISKTTDYQPSVYIETHGCKLNQADSSMLARDFVGAGYRMVDSEQSVDVYILNSCTVTHVADRKARRALRAAKRRYPQAIIVAAGCYPERVPKELESMEAVDLVFGNHDKQLLVSKVTERHNESHDVCQTGSTSKPVELLDRPWSKTRASVKIQEGCNQVCAYCIVPKVRGRERSILPEVIVSNISQLVDEGYKEVVLTGTQLGSYGFDLPEMNMTRLLRRILEETTIERIRVSSLQPYDIRPDLVDLWTDSRMCPHFHMPLQSGSDKILKLMRRRYTSQEYLTAVEYVRSSVANVSVTADVIVGFPGESDHDFEQTRSLCNSIQFASLHVFPYSARPGTSATYLDSHVPSALKSIRTDELISISKIHHEKFISSLIGKIRPVLWEESKENHGIREWVGLTDNYVRVRTVSELDVANRIMPSRILIQSNGTVMTELVETAV